MTCEFFKLFAKIVFSLILCGLGLTLVLLNKQIISACISGSAMILLGLMISVDAIFYYSQCVCYGSVNDDDDNSSDN